jgi:hypothetical protein
MRRLSGETGVYALVALLGCVCVLVSLDPTGQLAGTPLGVFDGPGLTLDEGFNVDVGVRLADSVLSGDLAEYARRTGELPDHPPLGRLWLGIAHELALLVVPVQGVDAPYVIGLARTGSAVAFGLALFLVGVTARRLATRLWPSVAEDGQPSPGERGSWGTSFLAGLAAMLALGTLPRMFAHAHIASLETCVALSWMLVIAYALDREEDLDQPLVAAKLGFLLGLAWLTKVQGVLLAPVLVAWLVGRALFWPTGIWRTATSPDVSGRASPRDATRRMVLNRWLVGCVIPMTLVLGGAGVTFLLGWPWLWGDVIGRTAEYLGRTADRTPTLVWYAGRVFVDKEVPWHYPWCQLVASCSLIALLCGAAGWFAMRRRLPGATALLAGCLLFPLVLFSVPGVAVYDSERLFSMIFPLGAVACGVGIAAFAHWYGAFPTYSLRKVRIAAASACLLQIAMELMILRSTWPCSLSAYGLTVEGLSGAVRAGYARTYWGDSITRTLMSQLRKTVPEGATIELLPVMHPFQIPVLASQTPAILEGRYSLIPYNTRRPAGRRFLLVFFRDDYLEPEFRAAVPPGQSLAEVRRQGVLLAGLYELPPHGD